MDFEINWSVVLIVIGMLVIGAVGFFVGEKVYANKIATKMDVEMNKCISEGSILSFYKNQTSYLPKCLKVPVSVQGKWVDK